MSMLEVANLAGVSTATVSRVINGHMSVSPDSAARVHEAMRQLKYRPAVRRPGPKPRTADGLRTRNIALLAMGESQNILNLPVVAGALEAVQDALGERKANLVVSRVFDVDRVPPIVAERQVDGVILVGGAVPEQLRSLLRRFPAVWLFPGKPPADQSTDCVMPDQAMIGEMAGEYLLREGARHAAFLRFDWHHPAATARGEAMARVLTAAGGSARILRPAVDPGTQLRDDMQRHAIVIELAAAYAALPDRPRGIFLPDDQSTVAMVRALEKHNLSRHHDYRMITCNNESSVAMALHPRPASIDLNVDAMGRRAVEQLIWRIRVGPQAPQMRINVSPTLVAD